MTFSRGDFRHIRWSLVLLAILAIFSAAIVAGAMLTEKMARDDARKVEAKRGEIRSKLAQASNEEQEIRAKIARYNDIVAHGYISAEQRLDWIERIDQIRLARKLIEVQYEMAPQKLVDAALLPMGASGGGYEFMSSTMRLNLQLLHENDLLGFLVDLKSKVRALLVVRGCQVERIPAPTGGDRATRAQLKAECEIDWITVRAKP